MSEGASGGFFGEFWYFLRHNPKWWLTPIFVQPFELGVTLQATFSNS